MFVDVHPFVQNTNNQYALPGVPVKNQMTLVCKAAIVGPYVVSDTTHARVFTQNLQATFQRTDVKLRPGQTEIYNRSFKDLLDILRRCL
jgi:hypothetical protein